VPNGAKRAYDITRMNSVKGAKQSLPLQPGLERFHCSSF